MLVLHDPQTGLIEYRFWSEDTNLADYRVAYPVDASYIGIEGAT